MWDAFPLIYAGVLFGTLVVGITISVGAEIFYRCLG